MTKQEVAKMGAQLLIAFGDRPFELSMPDEESYTLMRTKLKELGRPTGPAGEFFVIKVFPLIKGGCPASPVRSSHA